MWAVDRGLGVRMLERRRRKIATPVAVRPGATICKMASRLGVRKKSVVGAFRTALAGVIAKRDLTWTQTVILFGVPQPRISDPDHGKIDRFTVDALLNMLAHAGVKVRVLIGRSAA